MKAVRFIGNILEQIFIRLTGSENPSVQEVRGNMEVREKEI